MRSQIYDLSEKNRVEKFSFSDFSWLSLTSVKKTLFPWLSLTVITLYIVFGYIKKNMHDIEKFCCLEKDSLVFNIVKTYIL